MATKTALRTRAVVRSIEPGSEVVCRGLRRPCEVQRQGAGTAGDLQRVRPRQVGTGSSTITTSATRKPAARTGQRPEDNIPHVDGPRRRGDRRVRRVRHAHHRPADVGAVGEVRLAPRLRNRCRRGRAPERRVLHLGRQPLGRVGRRFRRCESRLASRSMRGKKSLQRPVSWIEQGNPAALCPRRRDRQRDPHRRNPRIITGRPVGSSRIRVASISYALIFTGVYSLCGYMLGRLIALF